jgi:hypothetical protein
MNGQVESFQALETSAIFGLGNLILWCSLWRVCAARFHQCPFPEAF